MNSNSDFWKGIACIIGGVSIHLFLGCLYLWGNIQVYLTSYFHIYNENVTLSTTLIMSPLLATAQGTTMFIGPYLLKRFPPRAIIMIGSTIALVGCFGSTFMTNFTYFAILYCFFGFGIGICYLVPLICAWEYFPEKKGLITGIIVGAFGFGAFFFGFISLALVNPNNASPDLEVTGGKIFKPETPEANNAPRMLRIN